MDAGIILEYEQGGFLKTKSIDLLDLRPEYVSHFLCYCSDNRKKHTHNQQEINSKDISD